MLLIVLLFSILGVYPYDYMDGFERFEEEFLPPKKRFYNCLKDIQTNDKDYVDAQTAFNKF